MNFVVLYNPPSHGVSFYDDLDTIFKHVKSHNESIFLGDFNINWLEKSHRIKLKRLLQKHSLQQMVKGPTRVTRTSKTMIDLIVTNRPERITRVYNLLTGLSDHNMILVARKLTKQRFQQFANKSKPRNQVIPKNKIV
jgi:endonuclease/exonuclease/phosphatase (EEP) superfamily protein YafD